MRVLSTFSVRAQIKSPRERFIFSLMSSLSALRILLRTEHVARRRVATRARTTLQKSAFSSSSSTPSSSSSSSSEKSSSMTSNAISPSTEKNNDFRYGYVDTHAHLEMILEKLDNMKYEHWIDSVREKEREKVYALDSILTIGCKPENWAKVEHFLQFEEVYGAFGVHPLNASVWDENATKNGLKALREKYPEKMKAIGECGLDYFVCQDPNVENAKEWVCPLDCREQQQFVFKEQILLAKELGLPLVVHARDAGDGEAESDCLDIMRKYCDAQQKIHVHCFTGTTSFARELLESFPNLKLGFTGVCTFKNGENVREVVKLTDMDRILLETDGPFMSPTPFRGKVAEPWMVPYIAKVIAEVKRDVTVEDVFEKCRENTRVLYGI